MVPEGAEDVTPSRRDPTPPRHRGPHSAASGSESGWNSSDSTSQAAACAPNVFQYHGTRDGTIGIDIGRRLAARIKGHNRKAIFVTVEGKHHGNAFRSEALQAELAPFLRRAFPA